MAILLITSIRDIYRCALVSNTRLVVFMACIVLFMQSSYGCSVLPSFHNDDVQIQRIATIENASVRFKPFWRVGIGDLGGIVTFDQYYVRTKSYSDVTGQWLLLESATGRNLLVHYGKPPFCYTMTSAKDDNVLLVDCIVITKSTKNLGIVLDDAEMQIGENTIYMSFHALDFKRISEHFNVFREIDSGKYSNIIMSNTLQRKNACKNIESTSVIAMCLSNKTEMQCMGLVSRDFNISSFGSDEFKNFISSSEAKESISEFLEQAKDYYTH